MNKVRKTGIYEKYIKRFLDITCASLTIICFSWLYGIIAFLVRIKLGSPVIFKQPRPGKIKNGKETIFDMFKFRTMTDERDGNGDLLPDEQRLTPFGKKLRSTSLDELPELINVIRGDMSLIGPRPQLVRDMVFMTKKQRLRHRSKPGISGLAQVSGRNAISWEEKLNLDLKYVRNVNFLDDVKLVLLTIKKVFGRNESSTEIDITDDYGDSLLKKGKIDKSEYDRLQNLAKGIICKYKENKEAR